MTQRLQKESKIISGEKRLTGRAVSRGIGIGQTLCLHGQKRQFYRINLQDSQLEKEIRRFRASVRLAKNQLKKIISSNLNPAGINQSNIFETHQLFLEDKSLLSKIESIINEQKVNAEWAVKIVTDKFIARYKLLNDKHLQEKYIDLEDVTQRILTALGGGKKSNLEFDENTIVIALELNPSTLIEISQNHPKAIITENGGWTSHTFILARELNLPAVTGVRNIMRQVESGENIIVDGFSGQIILHPDERTIENYETNQTKFTDDLTKNFAAANDQLQTLDGFEMTLRANLDLPHKYEKAYKNGAKGIGLYRSEFLFNQNKGFPGEIEQLEAYSEIGKLVGKDGIRIRTFDMNLEQMAIQGSRKEKNPALGLRGIRLSMKFENDFRRQIRALLMASHQNKIDILLPMITDISEIVWAKNIVAEEKLNLEREEIKTGNPQIGSMIEVPAAVFGIESILQESDFLSVGTNDLVQYILAVDRDNEDVADWYRTLHPTVLKSIKIIIEAANRHNKSVTICGEMAGSPLYVPFLVAFGASELSMNLNSIPRVRNIISNIAREESIQIIEETENYKTAGEIENFVKEKFQSVWSHLFHNENLPQNAEANRLKTAEIEHSRTSKQN